MDNNLENEKIEIDLLIQAIFRKYGYDFRNYAKASLSRRVQQRLSRSNLKTISEMQHKLLYDQSFFETLLLDLTINVTEMFRDPYFFKAIRTSVIPELKRQPFIKVWHAGCSSGEEVYSMAILLKEEGVAQTARIYATDTNEAVLQEAEKGIVSIGKMQQYSRNYMDAGGMSSFSDYYTARYESALLNKTLRKNVVFSCHNLVTDGVFGEMDLIICRNVLIYFNDELQNHVFGLFRDSLCPGGFLCLGSKESLMFTQCSDDFEIVAEREKIYRKKGKRG
ncbi:MAG TPA: protein-glutamate O-methyltransferase CheR [Deltaproteobacteria bacterium]|nr:protein-glutamate O-methyltransferase CheR [Deltaproteobacteria bacterium]